MVMVLEANEAVTPAGKPVGAPMPVAPVVVKVIGAGSAVLIQSVGEDEGVLTVLFGLTVNVTIELLLLHDATFGDRVTLKEKVPGVDVGGE